LWISATVGAASDDVAWWRWYARLKNVCGSCAGSGSRVKASTPLPSGPGQFTAVERSVGMSAWSKLMSTACR
jgi:hypothetical protein